MRDEEKEVKYHIFLIDKEIRQLKKDIKNLHLQLDNLMEVYHKKQEETALHYSIYLKSVKIKKLKKAIVNENFYLCNLEAEHNINNRLKVKTILKEVYN